MDITYVFSQITKSEKTADGDLMVFGKAAGPDLDLDGQRMDAAWLKDAMPRWYTFGNIRAQHSPIAAGIGVELTEGGGGNWTLKALVVDADSKNKVEKNVYKGYSVGIKGARVIRSADAPNGKIVGGEIVEISLVDRPANPTCLTTVCKAAGGELMLPTNELGGWLAPDMCKTALRSADDVLAGNFDLSDMEASQETIHDLADLIIHQAMALKGASLDGPVDIGDLMRAANALEFFVDSDVSDYPGGESQMQIDFEELEKSLDPDLIKRFFSQKERDKAENENHAMAGGKYPIETRDDVENAIKLSGQGSAPKDAIRAHIIEQAKRIGAEDMIPEDWESGNDSDEDDVAKGMRPDTVVIADLVKAAVAKAVSPLEERNKALEARLTEVLAKPVPGGPVLVTRTAPELIKMSQADHFAVQARRSDLSPEVRAAYAAAASGAGGAVTP